MNRGILVYLFAAVIAFLVATTGSDLFARLTIEGQPLTKALSEHFYGAGVQLVGTLMLFLPFAFLATIGSWVEEKINKLGGWAFFTLPTLFLIYSYFEGYQASKVAELEQRWTAATLSVGFLPFMAAPVVLVVWFIGFLVVAVRRKRGSAN